MTGPGQKGSVENALSSPGSRWLWCVRRKSLQRQTLRHTMMKNEKKSVPPLCNTASRVSRMLSGDRSR